MKDKENKFFEAGDKVITNNGRKNAKEIEPNVDMILVRAEDGKVRFATVKEVIEIPLQGKVMVTYAGTYVDICIQEDVNLFVCHEKSKEILRR